MHRGYGSSARAAQIMPRRRTTRRAHAGGGDTILRRGGGGGVVVADVEEVAITPRPFVRRPVPRGRRVPMIALLHESPPRLRTTYH